MLTYFICKHYIFSNNIHHLSAYLVLKSIGQLFQITKEKTTNILCTNMHMCDENDF